MLSIRYRGLMFLVVPVTLQSMEEIPLAEVGALAAARRRELTMDQAELARRANVDPKTVRAFERGQRWPRDKSRTRIEAALEWASGSLDRLRAGDKFPVRVDAEYLQRSRAGGIDIVMPNDQLSELRKPTSSLGRWVEIQQKPEAERTADDLEFLRLQRTERNRLAEVGQRLALEGILVDLVEHARTVASDASQSGNVLADDVKLLTRHVEDAVAEVIGNQALWDELLFRAEQKLAKIASDRGVLDEFADDADAARKSGVPREEFLGRAAAKLSVDVVWTPAGVRLKVLDQRKSSDDAESPFDGYERRRAGFDGEVESGDKRLEEGG